MGRGKAKAKRKHMSGTPEKLFEDKKQRTMYECLSPASGIHREEKVEDMSDKESVNMDQPVKTDSRSESMTSMLQATKSPASMETQMAKVIELLEVIVYRFQPEVESMKEGLNSQQKEIEELREENLTLEKRVSYLEGNLLRTEKVVADLKEDLLDLKARSMRDNIIVSGIPENESESRWYLLKALNGILATTLKMQQHDIDSIMVDRCHRLGQKKEDGTPRPVIYKITPSWAKDVILSHTKYIPKNSSTKVFEQFPPEIQERRKRLVPVLKEAKTAKKKAKLAVDKLIIEGKQYRDPATPTLDMTQSSEDIKIHHTDITTAQGSGFQGHLATINNVNQKDHILHSLYANQQTARATHNIWALRIKDGDNYITTWEDDGEYHAGRLLADVLETSGVENTMLIVSRWYGGTHMGPKRFANIKKVAECIIAQTSA